jgi:uncharacterized protein YciI
MYYAFIAHDRAGHIEVRKANREAHIAFLKAMGETLISAGPLLSDAGEMCGSLLILHSDDKQALQETLAQDPYAKAGLFETTELKTWNWVIGAPK